MCQCFTPEREGEREEPRVEHTSIQHPAQAQRCAFSSCLTPPRWSRHFQEHHPPPRPTHPPSLSLRLPYLVQLARPAATTTTLSVPPGPTTVAFTLDELHIWRPRVCTGSPPALSHTHTAGRTHSIAPLLLRPLLHSEIRHMRSGSNARIYFSHCAKNEAPKK